MAINATNRVHQCVFYPLSYWIHGGAAGDEYIWLFPTSAAMLDHPTRHAPPHMSCGRRWRTGRASGPYSSRRPRGWSALILYGRYGLIGRLSVSPIQIVWGFPPYVLYGQTSAYFQKWTGGGKTTLILYEGSKAKRKKVAQQKLFKLFQCLRGRPPQHSSVYKLCYNLIQIVW